MALLIPETLQNFADQQVTKPTVLIVEPNPYHSELLPGFTWLFQKLGYAVNLLVRTEVVKENSFDLFPADHLPLVYNGSAEGMKHALSNGSLKRYDFVFYSTNVFWEIGKNHSNYMRYLGFMPEGRYGALFVEHNLVCLDEDDARSLYLEGRVFTLLPYQFEGHTTRMINPHYFGDAGSRPTPHKRKKILLVGSSSRDAKNLDSLFAAIRKLKVEKKKKFLISVVGEKIDIPNDLTEIIKSLGRLNFHDYYIAVNDHDYLLTLIDLDSSDIIHTKYSRGTTSGTVQISLGFAKPMIIDDVHAKSYGFNASNAILYNSNGITDGLERALHVTDLEYADLIHNLRVKSELVENSSLKTLNESLTFLAGRNRKKSEHEDADTPFIVPERVQHKRLLKMFINKLINKIKKQ